MISASKRCITHVYGPLQTRLFCIISGYSTLANLAGDAIPQGQTNDHT